MDHYFQSVNKNGHFFLKISAVFQGDMLDLTVFQNEAAWTIKASRDELVTQAKKHNTPFNEYVVNLRKYFDSSSKDVEFDFNAGKFSINVVLKNKMKIIYFYSVLTKVNFCDSVFSLMDTLYAREVEYFADLDNIKQQHVALKNDYNTLEKKLNEFLDRRKSEEQKLYNNFVAILNEKKRQIVHLNELLIAFRQGRPTVNPPVQVNRKRNNQGKLKNKNINKTPEHSSDSEYENNSNTDDNYDTDEAEQTDNKVGISSPRQSSNLSPVPSTSKIQDEYVCGALPDSPIDPMVLPKRTQVERNTQQDIIVPKEEPVENLGKQETSSDTATSKDNSFPIVNFSTQDLLDNL